MDDELGMTKEGTVDLSDAAALRQKLTAIRSVMERADAWHRAGQLDFTERRMDEQKPGGPRVYILAHQLIGTALENYSSVFWLMQGANGITPVAPFNLIRPAFESALHALWILDAHDPRERCLRGLRLGHEDNKQKQRWNEAAMTLPFLTTESRADLKLGHSDAETVYRQEARELGVPWNKVTVPFNAVEEIKRLSFVRADSERVLGPMLLLSWRQLSGYQHGHMSAILRGSTKTADVNITGGVQARLTVDDNSIGVALQVAGLLQLWAMYTYLQRCRQPSAPAGR